MDFRQFIESSVEMLDLDFVKDHAEELGVLLDERGEPKIFYNVGPRDGPKVHENGNVWISERPIRGIYGPQVWKVVLRGPLDVVAKRGMTIDFYGDVKTWAVQSYKDVIVVGKE